MPSSQLNVFKLRRDVLTFIESFYLSEPKSGLKCFNVTGNRVITFMVYVAASCAVLFVNYRLVNMNRSACL